MPHLTQETIAAWSLPAEKRSPRQRETAAFADGLIAEVEAADVIVIAAPMYNFTISSTLKAWIDHLARAARTFRYTAPGPPALLNPQKPSTPPTPPLLPPPPRHRLGRGSRVRRLSALAACDGSSSAAPLRSRRRGRCNR